MLSNELFESIGGAFRVELFEMLTAEQEAQVHNELCICPSLAIALDEMVVFVYPWGFEKHETLADYMQSVTDGNEDLEMTVEDAIDWDDYFIDFTTSGPIHEEIKAAKLADTLLIEGKQ